MLRSVRLASSIANYLVPCTLYLRGDAGSRARCRESGGEAGELPGNAEALRPNNVTNTAPIAGHVRAFPPFLLCEVDNLKQTEQPAMKEYIEANSHEYGEAVQKEVEKYVRQRYVSFSVQWGQE